MAVGMPMFASARFTASCACDRVTPSSRLNEIVVASAASSWLIEAGAARSLADLQPAEVFAERLRRNGIAPDSEEGAALALTFNELLGHWQDAVAAAPSTPGHAAQDALASEPAAPSSVADSLFAPAVARA